MNGKKSKKTEAAAPAPAPSSAPETYKGWRATASGPISFSDELKASIDHYETLEPSDAEDLKQAIEVRGLERISTKEPEPWGIPSYGWQPKDPTALFEDEVYEELNGLIDSWADADDAGAADVEAVLIQRGLEKMPIAAEKRAERQIHVRFPEWVVVEEHASAKEMGKIVPLKGYSGSCGERKVAPMPTFTALLAGIAASEGVPLTAKAEPAPAPKSDPKASAASPADAQDLSARNVLREDHEKLKTKVADLERESKAGRAPEVAAYISKFNAERKRRIEHILHSTTDGLLAADIDIKRVSRLQERISVYQEDIEQSERSPVEGELEDARGALKAFEKKHELLLGGSSVKNPTAPGADVIAKADTKAKATEAKEKLDAMKALGVKVTTEGPGDGGVASEAAKKLEALLGEKSPPAYTGPVLSQDTRNDLGYLGFRWTGKTTAEATTALVVDALAGWKTAKAGKQKHRLLDVSLQLLSFGWERVEEKAAPLNGAALASSAV